MRPIKNKPTAEVIGKPIKRPAFFASSLSPTAMNAETTAPPIKNDAIIWSRKTESNKITPLAWISQYL